jgi:beta-lactamase class A
MIGRRSFLGATVLAGIPGLSQATPRLEGELQRLEALSGGRLGVALLDDSGNGARGWRGNERFPMCSTFKALASAALLHRVDAGQEKLDRRVTYAKADLVPYSPTTEKHVGSGLTLAEICEAAITLSDNTAGNLLLANIGGPAGLTAFARSLGDSVTRLDRTEPTLNEALPGDPRDTTSPNAMAATLSRLVLGTALSPASRAQLATWMVATRTGDDRLRAGLPKGWRVGDKTGTGERGTANDIAVIWPTDRAPMVMTVYLTGASGTAATKNAVMADVARAVVTTLS